MCCCSNVLDHESFKISDHEPSPGDAKSEFGYPPSEPRIDSKMFRHNYTTVLVDIRDTWNSAPGPFRLFPFQPKDRSLPTDAQFIGRLHTYRLRCVFCVKSCTTCKLLNVEFLCHNSSYLLLMLFLTLLFKSIV